MKRAKRSWSADGAVHVCVYVCVCEGKLEVKEESSSSWRRHVKCGQRQKAKEEKNEYNESSRYFVRSWKLIHGKQGEREHANYSKVTSPPCPHHKATQFAV